MGKTGDESLLGWQAFGLGFLETGGFTLKGQPGNEKPRMHRIVADEAIINRMGFNNPGAEKAAQTLAYVKPRLRIPLFINVGKGKDTAIENAPKEYADIVEILWLCGDGFVLNVSSPNTLGLRALQGKDFLRAVVQAVQDRTKRLPLGRHREPKPILVKVAPDLTDPELDDVLLVLTELRVSGVIATNTTIGREGLSVPTDKAWGLSGPPLFPKSLRMVRYIHVKAPELPIIGCGGIRSLETAYQMRCAGARLLQLYTGLVYHGPRLVPTINRGLSCQL